MILNLFTCYLCLTSWQKIHFKKIETNSYLMQPMCFVIFHRKNNREIKKRGNPCLSSNLHFLALFIHLCIFKYFQAIFFYLKKILDISVSGLLVPNLVLVYLNMLLFGLKKLNIWTEFEVLFSWQTFGGQL